MNRREAARLMSAMQDEIERARGAMRIQGHPRPYFISQLIRDLDERRVEGKFGSLMRDERTRNRNALVDVRVGDPKRDQVRGGGLRDNARDLESYDMIRMPLGGDAEGVRHALWRLTEAKYREACDDFLHKRAVELNYIDEHEALGAFQKRKAIVADKLEKLPEVDLEAWKERVVRASRSMKKFARVRDGHIRFSVLHATHLFVSSEGTRIAQAKAFYTVEIHQFLLFEDGFSLPQTRTFFVTDPKELPTIAQIRAAQAEMYRQGEALSKAPVLRGFSGPVLLDPKPAGLLIHEAIGHRLEGNRLLAHGEGQTFRDSIGTEVSLPGLNVRDDPRLSHYEGQSLVGHYHFDDEGVEADCADLIINGHLKGFLTTRAPIRKKHKSNGHARSAGHARAISRMGVTLVEAEEGLEEDALFERFLEEIRAQNAPYGIRIIEAYGGETSTEAYDFQAFLGEIDLAARVYPDGRQEYVRGADFVGTPLNALRGIIAAGLKAEVDNSYCGAESGFVPVTTISPALLIDELELQSKPARPMTQYSYPMPWQ